MGEPEGPSSPPQRARLVAHSCTSGRQPRPDVLVRVTASRASSARSRCCTCSAALASCVRRRPCRYGSYRGRLDRPCPCRRGERGRRITRALVNDRGPRADRREPGAGRGPISPPSAPTVERAGGDGSVRQCSPVLSIPLALEGTSPWPLHHGAPGTARPGRTSHGWGSSGSALACHAPDHDAFSSWASTLAISASLGWWPHSATSADALAGGVTVARSYAGASVSRNAFIS